MTGYTSEATGNTIYYSEDEAFSSCNLKNVERFEKEIMSKLNNSKFNFKSRELPYTLVTKGYCAIAEEFLDDMADISRVQAYQESLYRDSVSDHIGGTLHTIRFIDSKYLGRIKEKVEEYILSKGYSVETYYGFIGYTI